VGKRIISGLIGGIIVIVTLTCLPSYMCNIFAFLVAIASTYEFIKAINAYGYKPIRSISYASCTMLLFIGAVPTKEIYKWALAFIGLIIIASLIYAFFIRKGLTTLVDISFTFFVILYIDILLSFFLLTYYITNDAGTQLGKVWIWYVLFGACVTDIFAYFIGCKFGKHKLCPEISPKKTVEGALGGIFGCTLVFLIYTAILNNFYGFGIDYIKIGLISIIVAIFAQMGDLVASSIKRNAKIKDFGDVMPGHGGFLDRIDSTLFVSPIIYYFLIYFPHIF